MYSCILPCSIQEVFEVRIVSLRQMLSEKKINRPQIIALHMEIYNHFCFRKYPGDLNCLLLCVDGCSTINNTKLYDLYS